LSGVSCSSPSWCIAGGQYAALNGSDAGGLVLAWAATEWLPAEAPLLPKQSSAFETDLVSVSCPSPSSCTAVGTHDEYHYPSGPVNQLMAWTSPG
jgi:hypothetical protein